MTTLVDKANACAAQVGIKETSMPLAQKVDAIAAELGLSKEIAGNTLTEKVERCYSQLFNASNPSGNIEAVKMGTPVVPMAMASAVPVPMTMAHESSPQDDLARWLAEYPVSGGPRLDQLNAYYWFDSQGWASAWPLQRAAMRGEVHNIQRLCAGGTDPNAKMTPWYDSEPLGWAASLGQLGAVIALIQCGADPLRPKNKAGFTPHTDALRERHLHVSKFLVEYKKRRQGSNPAAAADLFNPSTHANGGPRCDQSLICITICCAAPFALCPLHCLSTWGCAPIVDCVTAIPVVKEIPIAPCSPHSINPLWCCAQPLGWAASFGQLHTVMALVKNGANPDQMNASGNNAYTDAGREKHEHVVEWLTMWESAGRPRGWEVAPTRWNPRGAACRTTEYLHW